MKRFAVAFVFAPGLPKFDSVRQDEMGVRYYLGTREVMFLARGAFPLEFERQLALDIIEAENPEEAFRKIRDAVACFVVDFRAKEVGQS